MRCTNDKRTKYLGKATILVRIGHFVSPVKVFDRKTRSINPNAARRLSIRCRGRSPDIMGGLGCAQVLY